MEHPTALGLTQKESARWSITRAVLALEGDPLTKRGAEYETELSNAIAARLGRQPAPGSLFVPLEVQHRTLTAGSSSPLVGRQTFAPGASFADSLRAQDPLAAFDIPRVGPFTRNFGMPQVTTAAPATWLSSELGTATAASPVYAQQLATPKTVASFFRMSRTLAMAAPPEVLDALVIGESARAVAAAVAAAFVAGSGTNGEPAGLIGVSGVGTQSGSNLQFAGVLNMIEAVEGAGLANPERAGFVIGTAAAKLLRTRERQTGAGSILQGGQIEGYRAIVTAAAPANAIVFGDMTRAAIAEWGVLEVGADPFTGFTSGVIGIRAIYSCDVLCLQPRAFCVSTGVS